MDGQMNGPGVALFDARYPESIQFSTRLAAAGATRIAVQADCAGLWHGGLLAASITRLDWIAGLTSCSDFEVMRSCARRHGFRSLVTGQHDSRGGDRISHTLNHRGSELDADRIFDGANWAARLADVLLHHDLSGDSVRTVTAATVRTERYPGTLFSWVLWRSTSLQAIRGRP